MNAEFWSGKRVFVTGHTGFKGSWLSLWLQTLGAQVVGYSLAPPTQPAMFELARVADGMESVAGDVRDVDHLRRAMRQQEPEVVFHLAAQPIVRESYRKPVETFATNVMGTVHLLEAVRHVKSVRAVVCVTSDKCYDNKEWLWGYREYEPMGGVDPYSSSKGCAELVTSAYRHSFFRDVDGVAVATARAGNVIGGGDWAADRLVPDVLRSVAAGEPVVIRNPRAIRPWQHVLDPLNGYLTLAEHLYADGSEYAESWNFGPPASHARSVKWVLEHLLSLCDAPGAWQQDERTQPYEDRHLTLDSSKASVRLRWRAHLELRTALAWVVEWTRALQEGSDMREVTDAQIRRFMSGVRAADPDGAALDDGSQFETRVSLTQQAELLELAPDPTIVREVDGTIVYWNDRAAQVYGWTKDEAVGQTTHSLLRTEFPAALNEMERELREKGKWDGALVHTTREGARLGVDSYWALQSQRRSRPFVLEVNRIRAASRPHS
jgi:CDP-glucose 4,6-dehydratase